MTIQIIDTTSVQPSGKIGDPAKTAFEKTNSNFNELYGRSGKNLLINAEGLINQRGFAGGALAAGVYGYDRFKAGTGGCNLSVSAGVWTHTSGPVVQVIEAPTGVYGASVTFSVEDPTGTISITVGGVSGSITAGSGRRGVTLMIPSGSGNLIVQWSATGVTYRLPQLELGDNATAFDHRQNSIELILCTRYYEKSYPAEVKPGTVTNAGYVNWFLQISASSFAYMVPLQVEKAVIPAVTLYSNITGAAGKVRDISSNSDVNMSLSSIGKKSFGNYFIPNTVPGNINIGHQWVAEAEL